MDKNKGSLNIEKKGIFFSQNLYVSSKNQKLKKNVCLPSDMKLFSLAVKYVYVFLGCLYFDFSHSPNYSSLLIFLLYFPPAHFAEKNQNFLCSFSSHLNTEILYDLLQLVVL